MAVVIIISLGLVPVCKAETPLRLQQPGSNPIVIRYSADFVVAVALNPNLNQPNGIAGGLNLPTLSDIAAAGFGAGVFSGGNPPTQLDKDFVVGIIDSSAQVHDLVVNDFDVEQLPVKSSFDLKLGDVTAIAPLFAAYFEAFPEAIIAVAWFTNPFTSVPSLTANTTDSGKMPRTMLSNNDYADREALHVTITGSPNLGDGVVGWKYLGEVKHDTDADGLPDCWELEGVPYGFDENTPLTYILADSNRNHKDLYVEVDAMVTLSPFPEAIGRVQTAFAQAPANQVNNPDGAPGINLHVDLDTSDVLPFEQIWITQDTNGNGIVDWVPEFDQRKASYFGTFSERQGPDATARLNAKREAFHYCIFTNSIDDDSSGLAETPGNDIAVGVGDWVSGGSVEQQAGVFMHELGHNLGLGHGGRSQATGAIDHTNYKPNYYSVMNYMWQMPFDWQTEDTWPLAQGRSGYAALALNPLNEDELDECHGLGSNNPSIQGVRFIHNIALNSPPNAPEIQASRMDFPIDWNGNFEIIGVLECGEASPSANPNFVYSETPSPAHQILESYTDWPSLVFNFREHPDYAEGVHTSGENGVGEMTLADYIVLNTLGPAWIMGDVDSNGVVDVDDLLALINNWGLCDVGLPCVGDIAPTPAGNGTVDVDDLLLVLNNWS